MGIPTPGVRRSLKLALPGLFPVEIYRLMDHEAMALRPQLQARRERPRLPIGFPGRRDLPAVFLAAERCFGRTSGRFDEYKGSFRFELLLVLRPEDAAARYVGVLRDHRCSLELELYPLTRPSERTREWVPSDHELESLRQAFLEFLVTGGTALARTAPSFVRSVPSELWIYGSREGDLFARGVSEYEAFAEHLRTIERDLEGDARASEARWIEGLLDDVANGVIRQR